MSEAFNDVLDQHGIDKRTKNAAQNGISAERRAMLQKAKGPMHMLAAKGVEMEGQTFLDSADDAIHIPTTKHLENSQGETVSVHLHQDVRESMDDQFGNFGSIDEDSGSDVVWTVVGLDNGTVDLTVVGDWSKRRSVEYSEFADNYEPLHLTNGEPQWGY